jgi:hypothetical protein
MDRYVGTVDYIKTRSERAKKCGKKEMRKLKRKVKGNKE